MKKIVLFEALMALTASAFAQLTKSDLKRLDAYFAEGLEQWDVPGMAVAIIQDGEVIFEKGYGVRDVRTAEAVDANTLFAVASNTKSMTAAALAMLVDEGKIGWDDKVQEYLPWFELYDPYVSANLTIRDLLCHRSGLATFSGDLIWYGSDHSREEVLRRAKHLKPKYGFREHYGYQNIMFLAAGQIIPVVTGQSWEDFVTARILTPLGMSETLYSVKQFTEETHLVAPHNASENGNIAIEWVNWDNIAPAGSMISSAHDWSKWMEVQLGRGVFRGDTLWSSAQSHEMWTVQTPEAVSPGSLDLWPSQTFKGYGLGWELMNMHGSKVVSHGGGYDGMISRTVMVPGKNAGIVVVTNSLTSLSYAATYKWLDVLHGIDKGEDWSALFLDFSEAREERKAKAREEARASRIENTTPSLDLEKYAGTYQDKIYGDLKVRVIGDQLAFQFAHTPIFRGTLRHWHYDTFELNWGTQMMLPSGIVQFTLSPDATVQGVQVDVPNPDFDFTELNFEKVE